MGLFRPAIAAGGNRHLAIPCPEQLVNYREDS